MAKFGARVRKAFTFASVADTLAGWLSPFLPKGLFVAVVWVGGIAFGLLQGMTPAGALLFALLCGGIGALFVNQGYALVERIQANRFPPAHEQKMLDLADALADLKSLVMQPGSWSRMNPLPHQSEHAAKYQAARIKVDKIAEEIRYDSETRDTAIDFAHLCSMVVSDILNRQDCREHLAELEKVSGPIFHRLHQGKGIKRARIPWPQWVLENDAKARERTLKPPIEKPKPKSATEQATDYIERITRSAPVAGPMETSYPRVLADSKRLVRKLGERIEYVDRVLEQSDPATFRKWRSKIRLQRIPFDDLKADKLAALSDREREQVRIAVGELDELELLVDTLIAEPKRYRLPQAAGMYKHRADKAREVLQELIQIMEDGEL